MKLNLYALKNWLILIGALLFLLVIIFAFISYAYENHESIKTIYFFVAAYKNTKLQETFYEKAELTIMENGYAAIKFYYADKIDYLDCFWNILTIPEAFYKGYKSGKGE
jgi:hypothetical protein